MNASTLEEINWRLTLRAVAIVIAIGLALSGVESTSRIACSVCWRDVTAYLLSVFGYVSGTGFAISLTLPEKAKDDAPNGSIWKTRRDCQEGALWLGVLMVIFAALAIAN